MSCPSGESSRKLEPGFLGPLTSEPTVDTGTAVLFPGEDRLLSGSAIKKTRRLLDLLAGPLEIATDDDEHILWVAAAQQTPTLLEWVGVGWLFHSLHQVALVFTDKRLIEILLDLGGRTPRTRYRTYAWDGASKIKPGIGKLKLHMEDGTHASWRIAARADRKLAKLLVPGIEAKSRSAVGLRKENAYRWLCPRCGASTPPSPEACRECHTEFKTPGLATLLALAFPGAGLYYAGRPILGTFDLLGELFLFAVFSIALATTQAGVESAGFAAFGLIFLTITKLESIHLSRIFVRRTLPQTERARGVWKTIAMTGGALSGVAVLGAGLAVGSFAPGVKRDLTFARKEAAWSGQRGVELDEFGDPDLRSVWTHVDGLTVYVDAYTMGLDETFADVYAAWSASLRADSLEPDVMDRHVPAGFEGFRCHVQVEADDGVPAVSLNYLLLDEEGQVVHHAYAYASSDEAVEAVELLDDLMSAVAWIPAGGP